jgi:hypothetical protein
MIRVFLPAFDELEGHDCETEDDEIQIQAIPRRVNEPIHRLRCYLRGV